jgi:hypothetical protein
MRYPMESKSYSGVLHGGVWKRYDKQGDGVTLWDQPELRKSYGFATPARLMCGIHADEIREPP